jgi:hypothetical protein
MSFQEDDDDGPVYVEGYSPTAVLSPVPLLFPGGDGSYVTGDDNFYHNDEEAGHAIETFFAERHTLIDKPPPTRDDASVSAECGSSSQSSHEGQQQSSDAEDTSPDVRGAGLVNSPSEDAMAPSSTMSVSKQGSTSMRVMVSRACFMLTLHDTLCHQCKCKILHLVLSLQLVLSFTTHWSAQDIVRIRR